MPDSALFSESAAKGFLWKVAALYFISAPKGVNACAPEDRALARELFFVAPESTRNTLAASLSLLLDRDLTVALASCEAERFRPGMAVIHRPREDDGAGRIAFMLGGFVNYDVGMYADGSMSESLPGNAPDSPFVRQASPSELEATLGAMPEPVAQRLARCVVAAVLLAQAGGGPALDHELPEF